MARQQEELIGDQESKQGELVLQGDAALLFLAEGPCETGPLSPSIPAGRQRLSLPCTPHCTICREGG